MLPQLALSPILYVIQDVTVRLRFFTGEGLGALISELAGIAGAGQLAGVTAVAHCPPGRCYPPSTSALLDGPAHPTTPPSAGSPEGPNGAAIDGRCGWGPTTTTLQR